MRLSENIIVSKLEEKQYLVNINSSLNRDISLEYSFAPLYNKKKAKKNTTVLLMERKGQIYSANIIANTAIQHIYFRLLDNKNKIIILDNKQQFNIETCDVDDLEDDFTEEELMLTKTNNTSTANQVETEQLSDYSVPTTLALVPMKDRGLEFPRKGLRFSYKLNKRIRLMLYKLFRNLPNFITGNYRRRLNL